MSHLDCG